MSQTPLHSSGGPPSLPPASEWSPQAFASFMSQFGLVVAPTTPGQSQHGTPGGSATPSLLPNIPIPTPGSSTFTFPAVNMIPGSTLTTPSPTPRAALNQPSGTQGLALLSVQTDSGGRNKRGRAQNDTGTDADDEDGISKARPRRRTKRPAPKKPLKMLLCGIKKENLTDAQYAVRSKLQDLVREELQVLTGITKNAFPQVSPVARNNVTLTDALLPPGTAHAGERTVQVVGVPWDLNFDLDVDDVANLRVLRRAAEVIWKEQSDPAHCVLPHEDVLFTYDDVLGLAKVTYRSWRRRYQTSRDAEKATTHMANQRKNRIAERQRRLRDDRELAWQEYHRRHGKDVRPLLEETAWMSAEESSLEDATPEEQEAYRSSLAEAGGLLGVDKESGIPVWGVVRPAWRTQEVNGIMDELDAIRRQQRKADGSVRNRVRVKRVTLNRLSEDPPVVAVYSFMMNGSWLSQYKDTHPDEEVAVRDGDVPGFERMAHDETEDGMGVS